jgi:hypothetical protein
MCQEMDEAFKLLIPLDICSSGRIAAICAWFTAATLLILARMPCQDWQSATKLMANTGA